MTVNKERVIQIVVAVLFVMGALALWGALANAAEAKSKDKSTSTITIVSDDGEPHSYVIQKDGKEWKILEDGEPVPEDRIIKHGNTRVVLDKDGRVVYQCLTDDEGKVIYSSTVPSGKSHSWTIGKMNQGLYLGVTIGEVDDAMAAQLGLGEDEGILVRSVIEDSPAEKAGLKAYDIITRIDDEQVNDISDLRKKLREIKEGDTITLTVLRKGKSTTIKAKPEKNEGHGIYAFDGKNFNFNFNKDFKYDIDPPDLPHTFRFYGRGDGEDGGGVGIISPESEKALRLYEKQLQDKQVEMEDLQKRLEVIEKKLQKLLEQRKSQ